MTTMIKAETDARVRAILPDEFSAAVWKGAIDVLNSANPIRAHLFAAAVRELLRHILHSMASNADVTDCSWYAPVPDTNGPTRRQRATFAIQGGLSHASVDALGQDHAEMHKALTTAFADLNQRTHVRPNTLLGDDAEIAAFAEPVVNALLDFLGTIWEFRNEVARAVESAMRSPVFDRIISETIGDIDILSTHSMVEGVDIEQVTVERIGPDAITYDVSGTVHVELLYGSGSDHERGEGASINENFPFRCTVTGGVDNIKSIGEVGAITVDTSNWYD